MDTNACFTPGHQSSDRKPIGLHGDGHLGRCRIVCDDGIGVDLTLHGRVISQPLRYNGHVSDQIQSAFSALVSKTRLSSKEVRNFLKKSRDPDYWRDLNPQLSVSGDLRPDRIVSPVKYPKSYSRTIDNIDRDGYFQWNCMLSESFARRLKRAVEGVRNAGWMAVRWPAIIPGCADCPC